MTVFNRKLVNIIFVAIIFLPLSAFSQEMTKRQKKLHAVSVASGGQLYDNPKLAKYVSEIGHKALAQSPHADRTYFFFVLDSEQVNAFTPGSGLVYISRGLLALIRSEGQLMGVLGHEIGHNVGKHLSRTKNKDRTSRVVSTAASILVGNSGVGDAIRTRDQVNISGFRRDLELEADQFGAEYLYKANYDPEEMLNMLGILKEQSDYAQKNGNGAGYHGIYATHPRNDKRLQRVIRQAGELPPGEELIGRNEYRAAIDGTVYGPNRKDNAPKGYDRYINNNLGITFLYPEEWSRVVKGSKIILKDPNETVQFKVTIEKIIDKSLTTEQALKAKFPNDLSSIEKLKPDSQRDDGTLAKHATQRVGLSNVARNSFHFQGIARNNQLTAEQDQTMVRIMRSFRRLTPKDSKVDSVLRIYHERLEPGDTFLTLSNRLGKIITEDELRLLNGFYPKGEPEPGTWLKLVKKEAID